jgi:hypothetical protein
MASEVGEGRNISRHHATTTATKRLSIPKINNNNNEDVYQLSSLPS